MPIISDYVDPAALTAFVREVPTQSNQILNTFLPDRVLPDIEAVIDSVTRVNRAAKFRSYDAETPIGQRDGLTQNRVLLPPLGQKTVLGEFERLQLERLRTGGQANQGLVDAIYNDAVTNTRAVRARMELARGDVLTDGKFTLTSENGLTLETDWGVPAGNLVAPAGDLWSVIATATPLADIRTWADTYTALNGEPPAVALTSRAVVSNMLRNAEIRGLAASLGGVPSIVTRAQLQTVLEAHGLPTIVEYDTQVNVNGSDARVIPADRFIMLPQDPSTLGYTAWGITAEALELAGVSNPTIAFNDAPGLIGVVLKEGDPVRTWTKVTGVGMPVIVDPNRLMVADVQ
jgi:hypothetical protein